MGISPDRIRIINPLDERCFSWDLSRDVQTPTEAQDLGAFRQMADGSVARAFKHSAEAGQFHIPGEREEAQAELLNRWSKTGAWII